LSAGWFPHAEALKRCIARELGTLRLVTRTDGAPMVRARIRDVPHREGESLSRHVARILTSSTAAA
jgi:hypothetical protein